MIDQKAPLYRPKNAHQGQPSAAVATTWSRPVPPPPPPPHLFLPKSRYYEIQNLEMQDFLVASGRPTTDFGFKTLMISQVKFVSVVPLLHCSRPYCKPLQQSTLNHLKQVLCTNFATGAQSMWSLWWHKPFEEVDACGTAHRRHRATRRRAALSHESYQIHYGTIMNW